DGPSGGFPPRWLYLALPTAERAKLYPLRPSPKPRRWPYRCRLKTQSPNLCGRVRATVDHTVRAIPRRISSRGDGGRWEQSRPGDQVRTFVRGYVDGARLSLFLQGSNRRRGVNPNPRSEDHTVPGVLGLVVVRYATTIASVLGETIVSLSRRHH